MVDVSSLKQMGKKAYHWAEPKIIRLPYGDKLLEGIASLGFAGIYTIHFLEGTDMATPPKKKPRPATKGDFDELAENLYKKLDMRFNESTRRVEGENRMIREALERREDEMAGLSEELDGARGKYEAQKAIQAEKDEKNTAAFRAREEEMGALRERNSELEKINKNMVRDKGESARAMERKDEELKSIRGNKYSFDIFIPITEMGTGGSSMYPMTEKNVIYDFAAWIQKANEADLPREHMNNILKLLEQGGSLPRKPRRKAFLAMLEGDPKDAMKILNSHKICLP